MENKNETQELSEIVTKFPEGPLEVTQSVRYIPDEQWVVVIHNNQELSMSRENWESIIKLASRAISGITDQSYSHLKNLKMKEAAPILEKMSDLEIMDLIREDASVTKLKYWDIRGMTKLLLQELFKRNGLGHKGVNRLSRVQRGFIENLNIYEKAFYGKP